MLKTAPFETNAEEYDAWFDKFPEVFASEVGILRAALPEGDIQGIEVGMGTGRFAEALSIKEGVEPAEEMRKIAYNRVIDVRDANAEQLPYKDLRFDFVLTTAISYFNSLETAFKEANRVLKKGGTLVVGFIDRDSKIGKFYQSKKEHSTFYKEAVFYTPAKVADEIKKAGFTDLEFTQTLFENLGDIKLVEPSKHGYGEGSFVVIKAIKK